MCPRCNSQMQPHDVSIYNYGVVIYLRYTKCEQCNLIADVDIKFTQEEVH